MLAAFESLFRGVIYEHRRPYLGNQVAANLYEDLYEHGGSAKLNERVRIGKCVVNIGGSTRGVMTRRGDGTFGATVPGSESRAVPGFMVPQGMVALTQIAAEFKIVSTAQQRQIGRVLKDLEGSADSLRAKSRHAIAVGFAAVNYTEAWTGIEGDRSYPVTRKPARAIQESQDIAGRLSQFAAPKFDEFLVLKFKATNQEPYPFRWLDGNGIAADYGAALVRIADLYEKRF